MQALIRVSPASIRALHSSFTEEERFQLLSMQYRDATYQDAIVSGNAFLDSNNRLWMLTKRSESSFKGMVFEAFLARVCREQSGSIGRKVFAWCTESQEKHVTDSILSKYTAFVTADKSLKNNRTTAWLYNTASPFDVQFYKVNEKGDAEIATLDGSGTTAGVQVKAITGSERSEIIEPMLRNRYRHVLTLLKHANGEHSYDACIRLLRTMEVAGEITSDDCQSVFRRLARPEMLGLDQYDVDQYSYYLGMLHQRGGLMNPDVHQAMMLEVMSDLQESEGGILIPAQKDLILPKQQPLH